MNDWRNNLSSLPDINEALNAGRELTGMVADVWFGNDPDPEKAMQKMVDRARQYSGKKGHGKQSR